MVTVVVLGIIFVVTATEDLSSSLLSTTTVGFGEGVGDGVGSGLGVGEGSG